MKIEMISKAVICYHLATRLFLSDILSYSFFCDNFLLNFINRPFALCKLSKYIVTEKAINTLMEIAEYMKEKYDTLGSYANAQLLMNKAAKKEE